MADLINTLKTGRDASDYLEKVRIGYEELKRAIEIEHQNASNLNIARRDDERENRRNACCGSAVTGSVALIALALAAAKWALSGSDEGSAVLWSQTLQKNLREQGGRKLGDHFDFTTAIVVAVGAAGVAAYLVLQFCQNQKLVRIDNSPIHALPAPPGPPGPLASKASTPPAAPSTPSPSHSPSPSEKNRRDIENLLGQIDTQMAELYKKTNRALEFAISYSSNATPHLNDFLQLSVDDVRISRVSRSLINLPAIFLVQKGQRPLD